MSCRALHRAPATLGRLLGNVAVTFYSHLERRSGPISATQVLVMTCATNCVFSGKGRREVRGRKEGNERRKEEKKKRWREGR